jgi:hypothetical protein
VDEEMLKVLALKQKSLFCIKIALSYLHGVLSLIKKERGK